MPPTYLHGTAWDTVMSTSVPGFDRRLAYEDELSLTSQASRRLSAIKTFYVNIIYGRNVWRNNSIFPTIPYLQFEWLKSAPIFANGDTSQMCRRVLEQIAERRQVGEYEN